jgi:hypothetical protein
VCYDFSRDRHTIAKTRNMRGPLFRRRAYLEKALAAGFFMQVMSGFIMLFSLS